MTGSKKFFLTKSGLSRVEREYQELLKLKAFKTTGESPRIFHSEEIDPEFLAFQEDLELLETRIIELEDVLKNSQVISSPPKERRNVVALGATVTIEVDGEKDEFEIVGTLEADPRLGRISDESMVGRALIGLRVGEEVTVQSPVKTTYKIKAIRY
ncbi:GreA/GreB family elongation factor [Candidatus Parcubacteria bacterium]|nr:GreA/GreB family elongation factor [Patescibacteria group bacterium]MBU4466688.1 GreA/GreB family elongation factor [Patescibacteria group bacterium]MCG2688134.1 GreA/GreB family elongation factor [Candidatus Parcubacteria bacterium]